MRSREVIEKIKEDGWYEVEVKGSHHPFKHRINRDGSWSHTPRVIYP